MMTTTRTPSEMPASSSDQIEFECAVVRLQTHPRYLELDEESQQQIDAIVRFARTSPDKLVYTSRLLAAMA